MTDINEQTLLKRNLNVPRITFLPCEQNVVGKLFRTTKSYSQLLQREQNFRASSSRAALFVRTYHRRLMSRLIAGLSVVPGMATRGRGRPAPARKAPAFWRGSRQGRAERRRTLWPAWCKRPGIHRRYASKHFDIVGGIAAASSVRRIIRLNCLPVRSMSDVRHLLFNTAEASHEAALPAHLRFYFVRHWREKWYRVVDDCWNMKRGWNRASRKLGGIVGRERTMVLSRMHFSGGWTVG